MKRLFYVIIVLIFTSCGTQKQLQKAYLGKSVVELKEKLGAPKTVLDRGDEKIFVYELTKNLESTEVGQGKLTLDPIITPKVQKTERYYFTIKNGVIIKTKLEEEYKR